MSISNSNEKNEKNLEFHMEQLSIQDNSKYLEDLLDEAIIIAMKGERKSFCLKIESYLNDFMRSNKQTDKLVNLDKFQRKIVHKICDIYFIKREYVDVKGDDKGDITLSKTELSRIPEKSLESCFKKHTDEKIKINQKPQPTFTSSTVPSKILIKKKTDDNPGISQKQQHQPKQMIIQNNSKTTQIKSRSSNNIITQDKEKDIETLIEKKNLTENQETDAESEKRIKEYEEARKKIFSTGQPETTIEPIQQTQKVIKKKVSSNADSYDPAFDRSKAASHIQKNIKNDIENTPKDPLPQASYMMMFPQLGGIGMNSYMGPYPMMNPYPTMMMNPYPANIMGGYPQPYPQNFNTQYTGSLGKLLNPENLQPKKGPQIQL